MQTFFGWEWVTTWTAVSAIFTAVAAGVAVWAILRWSKQDELKAKLGYKKAICHYAYSLAKMPSSVIQVPKRPELEDPKITVLRDELVLSFSRCTYEWFICEDLFKNNRTVIDNWNFIVENHQKYINGDMVDVHELVDACIKIMKKKFIFS